jgi:acyl-homoserine-lactone acylase
MRHLKIKYGLIGLVAITLLSACSESSDSSGSAPDAPPPPAPEPELTYVADIVWTEYGIPHISADDWGSLGYGYGYALAQQSYCVVMAEYVRAAGESARYLGEDGDLEDDLVMKLVNDTPRIERLYQTLPEYFQQNLVGYTAGLNRYLNETGVANLAEGDEGCRGAEWVREVDAIDAVRLIHKTILIGSALPLASFTVAAEPLDAVASAWPKGATVDQQLAALDRETVVAALDMPQGWEIGSNAYAVGEQASQTNTGILFGNPHFPWQGPQRFHMSHQTMGDEYDVLGGTLHGVPMPVIGYNRNLAWSHTVSTAGRFTFYELELNPQNSMQYIYDGEARDITAQTVSAERKNSDGSVETVEHTFYSSHFGPIVDLGVVSPLLAGWPNAVGTLLTYRDANLENIRGMDQWVKMGQAQDMAEFTDALRAIGIPWVNTLAADRNGDAFYGDISASPHVSLEKYGSCIRGTLQTLLTDFGYTTMDGSDSACEWGNDEGTAEGVLGYDSLPKLETREYVANANDSYWLSNPRQLLEGFSPVIGGEGIAQSMRTRATFAQAEDRLAGSDGLGEAGFSVDNVRQMLYSARNYTAEQMVDSLVANCSAVEDWSIYSDDSAGVEQACTLLGGWNKRHDIESVGAHIFYQFWLEVRSLETLWAVPFDPSDPINTPNTLNTADADTAEQLRQGLADAVATLNAAGIPLDAVWGDIQFDEKNGVRHPIHGGASSMMFSVITSELVDGEGYSNIRHGNSYIQAVTWDESDCPDAYNILTYSQSTDPAHGNYADATELYSNGGWIDVPFCTADIEAQEVRRESIQE